MSAGKHEGSQVVRNPAIADPLLVNGASTGIDEAEERRWEEAARLYSYSDDEIRSYEGGRGIGLIEATRAATTVQGRLWWSLVDRSRRESPRGGGQNKIRNNERLCVGLI